MKKSTAWCFFLLITFLSVGCKEFIEPDISNVKIILKAPGNHFVSPVRNIQFWWGEEEDALQYRIQIVSPGFKNTEALIKDTLIKAQKVNFRLVPGDYEWRVQALNSSTKGKFSSAFHFSVANNASVQFSKKAFGLTLYASEIEIRKGKFRLHER